MVIRLEEEQWRIISLPIESWVPLLLSLPILLLFVVLLPFLDVLDGVTVRG